MFQWLFPSVADSGSSKKMGHPIRKDIWKPGFRTPHWIFEEATLYLLGDCGYWNRLWVIQEIGKAADIEICYTTNLSSPSADKPATVDGPRFHFISWVEFITKISALKGMNLRAGVFRLHHQLTNKSRGSHTLRSLLETHHMALCKNPRDKVYGLAGLAEDCYGFPVDYGKSLFEVWTDTLKFLQDSGQVKEDLPGLAGIMMNALGGPSEVMPPPGLKTNLELELRLVLIGTVANIGPTPEEIICNLSTGDAWAAKIHKSLKGASVHDNENLTRRLLQMKNPNVASLEVRGLPGIHFEEGGSTVRLPKDHMGEDCLRQIEEVWHRGVHEHQVCGKDQYRIHQLRILTPEGDGSWVGIATGNFIEGDLICCIPETGTVLLLRTTPIKETIMTGQGIRYFGMSEAAFVVGIIPEEGDGLASSSSFPSIWRPLVSKPGTNRLLSIYAESHVLFTILFSERGTVSDSFKSTPSTSTETLRYVVKPSRLMVQMEAAGAQAVAPKPALA